MGDSLYVINNTLIIDQINAPVTFIAEGHGGGALFAFDGKDKKIN